MSLILFAAGAALIVGMAWSAYQDIIYVGLHPYARILTGLVAGLALLMVSGFVHRPFSQVKREGSPDWPTHTTYDQLRVEQQTRVLDELTRQAIRLCDCQLDRQPAHLYMVRVAVPVERGNIDVEYRKLITRRYLLRPTLTIHSRVVSDTLRTYQSTSNQDEKSK